MGIFGNRIEDLIDRLESSIPNVDTGFSFGFDVERHDWRPVWALCKEIQAEFKTSRDFKSTADRQVAWQRFQTLRNRASHLADVEKEKFAEQSDQLKREILEDVRSCYWSSSADFFIGSVLGETTVDEMKQLQALLNKFSRRFSDKKGLMTREDKDECFKTINDVRASHDRFWEKHHALSEERRAASKAKREEYERRRSEWLARTQANIDRNREKIVRAEDALERARERRQHFEEKLTESNSPKWEQIFLDKFEHYKSKEEDIEESIERIKKWIRDDEDKLN